MGRPHGKFDDFVYGCILAFGALLLWGQVTFGIYGIALHFIGQSA